MKLRSSENSDKLLHHAETRVCTDKCKFRLSKTLILFFLVLIAGRAFSQSSLNEAEITIQRIHSTISPTRTDLLNLASNDSIITLLEQTLNLPGAFEYPFESLKFLGKIVSDDKKVRIFTWNLPLSGGMNRYYGFILHKPDNKTTNLFRLTDNSSGITNPEFSETGHENWYGCLVYDIIDTRNSGETWYTLLGYDPDNLFTTKKLVDILWFNEGKPVFGKPVFKTTRQLQHRMLFEYSARVQMTLTWDSRLNMIVFDHLAPSSPAYQGNFRYYGPDLSFDGLKFEKGLWEIRENIDLRTGRR